MSDQPGGAKRRSGIPTMHRRAPNSPGAQQRLQETDKDSGLSSESTTPTNGSPPPPARHHDRPPAGGMIPRPRTKMVDIIAASKARLQESSSRLGNNRTSRLLSSRSSTDSPRSLDGAKKSQIFSPLRPSRNIQSPSLDSGDEGSIRIERGTYGYMFQDIVSIKTMLLKLKRVLQEDSLSPFDNSLKNGLFYNLNDDNSTTTDFPCNNEGKDVNVVEELADLRRQVVFLQSQLDDKDETILALEAQLSKYKHNGGIQTANVTTQTEKLRPASVGPPVVVHSQDNNAGYVGWKVESDLWSAHHHHHHHHHHQHQPAKTDQMSSSCSSGVSTGSRPASSSRRSSSSSISDHRPSTPAALHRPSSLRGLRLPNGSSVTPPGSTSSIPTPTSTRISRLTTSPTMIPRASRALSASGRTRDS